jgi:hypothetical protein
MSNQYDEYENVLDPKVKSFTFTKVNKLIGTPADFPKNFQTSLKGKWDVVPVLGPDLQVEKGIKFRSVPSPFPVLYNSKYETRK